MSTQLSDRGEDATKQYPQIKLLMQTRYLFAGDHFSCQLREISMTGFSCHTDREPPLDGEVEIEIPPGGPLEAHLWLAARVVEVGFSGDCYCCTCSFLAMDLDLQDQLRELLRYHFIHNVDPRRQSNRLRVSLPARITLEQASSFGFLEDISREGLYFVSDQQYANGDQVVVDIKTQGFEQPTFTLIGEVVRIKILPEVGDQPRFGYGVRLHEDEKQLALLQDWIVMRLGIVE